MTGRLKQLVTLFRSAITGRFVSKRYAAKHPDTTVREKQRK
jgi:hypothetical protein